MVEIKNVSKRYSKKTVLNNFSYTFEKGRIYGIMGENGAGKSTLFRCMLNLERYDGSIIYDNNIKIGFLPDIPYFYSLLTGKEYIEFCLKARRQRIDYEEIELLNSKFNLPLDSYASTYSLGMKKRLALMTLMLQDNDVIILDEPFNGLDLSATIILKTWLRQIKDNRIIILSSHIISSISETCDSACLFMQAIL